MHGFIYAAAFKGDLNIPIVVDNTNSTIAEIAPYYATAEALECEAEIVCVDCHPDLAASRNIHGVSNDDVWAPKYWKHLLMAEGIND